MIELLHIPKNAPSVLIALPDKLKAELISNLKISIPFQVVNIFTEGTGVMDYLRKFKPQYLLLDIKLENCDYLDLIKKFKKENISTKIIFYLSTPNIDSLKIFSYPFAVGFIHRGCGINDLKKCLTAVFEGRKYFSSELNDFINQPENKDNPKDIYNIELLTSREKAVLKLLMIGKSEKEIAESLFISNTTVRTHKNHIREKFGIKGKQKLSVVSIQLNA